MAASKLLRRGSLERLAQRTVNFAQLARICGSATPKLYRAISTAESAAPKS
jgi:hypothetical protein